MSSILSKNCNVIKISTFVYALLYFCSSCNATRNALELPAWTATIREMAVAIILSVIEKQI